ncbi:MAG: hypothetical protein R3F48_00200 [Candidatus Zixiibacteriota bacterium]
MSFKREIEIKWPLIFLTVKDKLPDGDDTKHGYYCYEIKDQPWLKLALKYPRKKLCCGFDIVNKSGSYPKVKEELFRNDIDKLKVRLRGTAFLRTEDISKPLISKGGIKQVIIERGLQGVAEIHYENLDKAFSSNFDNESFDKLLADVDEASSITEKGNSYETLVYDLLTRCTELFKVVDKHVDNKSGIVDIVVQVITQSFFGNPGDYIIVECKNRIGTGKLEYIQQINSYMSTYKAKWGIVFAINEESPYSQQFRYTLFLTNNQFIVNINRKDLDEIREKRNLISMINRKQDELVMNRAPKK